MDGQDKCLASLASRPMIAHVIARLEPQVAMLALNTNAEPSRFAGFGLPIIADRIAGQAGPLAGLHAALAWGRELRRKHPPCRHGRLRYAVSAR
jgi:molybdopterin-guanine dinucleotide biosynthesis protein A